MRLGRMNSSLGLAILDRILEERLLILQQGWLVQLLVVLMDLHLDLVNLRLILNSLVGHHQDGFLRIPLQVNSSTHSQGSVNLGKRHEMPWTLIFSLMTSIHLVI